MATYKWLFHSSRYPAKPSDTTAKFDPKANNHIVVIRKNRFFVVPLAHASGRDLRAAELKAQFNAIIEMAGEECVAPPIGVLTSDNRDVWAEVEYVGG
jgi:carnitine O-acetyltransferase